MFNNTFQLVKVSFSNPTAALQSIIKLEQLEDLVKRMSVEDLYDQENVQSKRGAAVAEHHRDNETERIKPMKFYIKAVERGCC